VNLRGANGSAVDEFIVIPPLKTYCGGMGHRFGGINESIYDLLNTSIQRPHQQGVSEPVSIVSENQLANLHPGQFKLE